MQRRFLIFTLLTFICAMTAHSAQPNAPHIADYLDNKRAALSFTFDDGFLHQVHNTVEIIEPLGIHGTFFLIPHKIPEGPNRQGNMVKWEDAKILIESGHEVGMHGSIKNKLHEIDDETLEFEINDGSALLTKETGLAPVTYAAPGGSKITDHVEAKIREHHYFIRNKNLLPRVKIIGYGNAGRRVWDDQKTRKQIEQAIDKGEWVIPVVHAIVKGYSPFKSKDEFRIHCEWLAQQKDLWIAPMGEVGRYVFERDAAKLNVIKQSGTSLTFSLTQDLEPADVFNAPLTVVIPTANAKSAVAKAADGTALPVTVTADNILVNTPPNGQTITVAWQ